MIQKKICMIGAFAVGKTSLVARFAKSIFTEIYQTTIGVKIDKKLVKVGEQTVNLILWDIYGEDGFQKIRPSYLQGASGYFLVVDGTRRATLEQALLLQQKVESVIGKVPFVLLLNKSDLSNEWEIDDVAIAELTEKNWIVIQGSAKTGLGVETAFLTLTQKMLEKCD